MYLIGVITISNIEIDEVFNKNTKDVFKQFVDIDLDERVYKASDIKLYDGVSIVVSFSGIVSGQIIVNITSELTKVIYHRYTKGILAVEIDKNVKETIFELSKLIIGNSCASFYGNGISMEIASYCITEGNDVSFTWIDKEITIIDYETLLSEMRMMLILDINGKLELSDFNN